jgi:hypothetical protein
MKTFGNLLLLMLAIGMILVACTTQNVGNKENTTNLDQSNPVVEIPSEELEPQVEDSIEENNQTESVDEEPFAPTPSAVFEQNYGQNELSDRDYSDLDIVTLLPKDAIPAFTFPEYYSVEEANQEYVPDEFVIGVEFNGDARAYSVSLLSRHEIVNETVGGIHLAVTW